MILVNPGGPGGSVINEIITLANQEHISFLGSNYDGVGWDPRGIGYALPSANCTLTPGLQIPLGPSTQRRFSIRCTAHHCPQVTLRMCIKPRMKQARNAEPQSEDRKMQVHICQLGIT